MHATPANENGRKVLIGVPTACRGGMNTATASTKSVEENVSSLNTVCHVVETQAPYALVHASPNALARIIGELGFTVSPSKRGGDYYIVRVGQATVQAVPQAPASGTRVSEPAPAPRPAPQARQEAPRQAPAADPGRININGTSYVVRETNPKRSQDARRWEVRKVGDEMGKPYVVTFQDHDGCNGQCSCPDWIYRRHTRPNPDCKHVTAFKAAFGRKANVA
jgi:hypothetical protein